MDRIIKIALPFFLTFFLTACFNSDLLIVNFSNNPVVDVVFPKQDAISVKDKLKVRVKPKKDVSELKINNVDAVPVSYMGREFLQAEIPLVMGENDITVTFMLEGNVYTETTRTVRREPVFFSDMVDAAINPADNSLLIRDGRVNALFKMTEDGMTSVVKQFHVEDSPSNAEDNDEAHEKEPQSFVVSADGTRLYYIVEVSADPADEHYLYELSLADGTQTLLYGPESLGYVSFYPHYEQSLTYLPNEGVAGSLMITTVRDQPLMFDLDSKTMASVPAPAINSVSGVSSQYLAHLKLTDNNLLAIAKNNANELFTFEVDLRSCDGQPALCELTVSNYQTAPKQPDGEGCGNPARADSPYFFHSNKQHIIFDDYPKPCYIDLATNTMYSLYRHLGDQSDIDRAGLVLAGNRLLIQEDNKTNERIREYRLADDFTTGTTDFSYVGADTRIGDPSVNAGTGREVVVDDANNRLIYLDRNNQAIGRAVIYVLDFATGKWRKVGDYPATGFEIAVLNPADDLLYVYNDSGSSDDELFAIDLSDGSYELLIGASEKALVNYPNFNVDSIALNADEQLIYLARRVNSDDLPDNSYGRFSLLSYNIKTKVIEEISEVNNIAEQQSLYASYDMSFDAANRRVLFFRSSGVNPIWAVDVDTGLRSIFTDDENFYGPDTSNARGQVMDAENNRILFTSQDSQSVYAADLDTGVRTMVSEASVENDVFFRQIIGIDLFESDATAFVADEGFDGIYQLDLITGNRVLIHNPL